MSSLPFPAAHRAPFVAPVLAAVSAVLVAASVATPAAGQAGPGARPVVRIQAPDSVMALEPSAIEAADALLDSMDAIGSYRRLVARLEVDPDDFAARWRAARAALALGIMETDNDRTVAWLRAGDVHADAALALRPDDPESLVWAAAIKGRLAIDAGGAREKVRLGQAVWDLGHRLLEIEPDHALGHDVLGKLHQEVRRLAPWQRWLARAFMGSDPIKLASWDDAEAHLTRAIELDPGYVVFYRDLRETYWLQGKLDEAVATFRAGLEVDVRYPTDPKFKRVIRERLAEIAAAHPDVGGRPD